MYEYIIYEFNINFTYNLIHANTFCIVFYFPLINDYEIEF